jgi:prephenate dehydrogenase
VTGFRRVLFRSVLIASPEDHDRAMAETQCLFHLMARVIQEMEIHLSEIATPGPEKLFRDFAILQKDTRQLFVDMQTLNPFAEKRRKEFIAILEKMDADLTPHKG